MDQVIIAKLSRRLKAEKILLDALVEFVSESQGENATPIDAEDLSYLDAQLKKLNAERKTNRAFYKQSVKRLIQAQSESKQTQSAMYV